jgi:VIT1/CCC1 family predicted Fe2+/Mn2+ transporter
LASVVPAGFAFFAIGAAKGIILNRPVLRAGVETFLTGGGAALLAYLVGSWLRAAFGVA